ncbi:hypothetical protein BJ508DRAFT_323907 [Ascobolus immersus RN42]|uniref:Uncharacterized protein n=1 Tax=Ascobolus immersus RN42 TaxID=1160509 RepID=A0A3N4IER6_ASCIM|nr:hypothetical protein BJ508DRAFT_323907 [Ascobolus immersus RN42]
MRGDAVEEEMGENGGGMAGVESPSHLTPQRVRSFSFPSRTYPPKSFALPQNEDRSSSSVTNISIRTSCKNSAVVPASPSSSSSSSSASASSSAFSRRPRSVPSSASLYSNTTLCPSCSPFSFLTSLRLSQVVRETYRRTFASNDRIDRSGNTYQSPVDKYGDKGHHHHHQQQYSEDRQFDDLNFSFAQQDDDYMADMMPPMPRPEELSGSKRQREQSSFGSYEEAYRKRARRSPSPPGEKSYVDIDDVDDDYLRDFGGPVEGNHSTPNASTRSRHSIFGSGRRLKTIKPRKSRFIEGSMGNRHSEKPPSVIIGSQTEYDAVSPQLKSGGGAFNENRTRSKPAGEEFSVAGLASAVFTFRAVSYFKDTYWTPRKQKFEEMIALEEQKKRAEEAYQELKKRGMPGTVHPLPPRLQVPPGEYARRKEAARRSREASELMDIDRSRGPSVHSNVRMDEDEDEDELEVGTAVTTDQILPAESYSPKKRHSRKVSDDTAATLVDDYMSSSKSPSSRHQSENPEMEYDFSDRYSHRSPSYQPIPAPLSQTRTNQTTYTQHTQASSSYQTPVRAQTQQTTASAKSTTSSTVKTLKQRASKLFTPRGSAAQKLEEARRERLLKKYSNLEDKLLKARQELEEAGVAPPPLPETLGTSPSQRSLHGSFNGAASVRSAGSRATSQVASPTSPASPVRSAINGVFGPLTSPKAQRQPERGNRRSESLTRNNAQNVPLPASTPTPTEQPVQMSHVAVDVPASRRGRQGSAASTRTAEGERMSVDTTRERAPTERMSVDTTRESMPPPSTTPVGGRRKVESVRSNAGSGRSSVVGSIGSAGTGSSQNGSKKGKLNGGSIRLVSS